MIGGIEGLGTELELQPLIYLEILEDREIYIVEARPVKSIS
jgi:hypothetical protein